MLSLSSSKHSWKTTSFWQLWNLKMLPPSSRKDTGRYQQSEHFPPLMGLQSQRQVLPLCQELDNTACSVISIFHPMNQQISNQRCPTQMWKPLLRTCKLQTYMTGTVCSGAGWQALPGTGYQREEGSEEGMRSVPGWAAAWQGGWPIIVGEFSQVWVKRIMKQGNHIQWLYEDKLSLGIKAYSTTWTMWDASNYSMAALDSCSPPLTAAQWRKIC